MKTTEHILVDGWNVIHSHPKLARILSENKAEEAQSELSNMLAPMHDYDGSRITIVYDGVGAEISIVRRSKILTFSEVFTPSSMTADELIEQLCATSKSPQNLLVVSRDNLLRLTASTFGAMTMTPDDFLKRGENSKRAVQVATNLNNEKVSREWKKSTPFAKLDELLFDIESATKSSALMSKRLKKKSRKNSDVKTVSEDSKAVKVSERKLAKKNEAVRPTRPIIGGKAATLKSLEELKSVFDAKKKTVRDKRRKK